MTRAEASRFTSSMGTTAVASNPNIALAYQTLWSSMIHTGVQNIGGQTFGDARLRQEAGLNQLRSGSAIQPEVVAIIASGPITREAFGQFGIPTANRVAINLGLQSASFEVRHSSVSGLQMRVNIDSTLRVGPGNLRTRITYDVLPNGSLSRTSGDIGINSSSGSRPRSGTSQGTPNSSVFGGVRFTSEGVSATGSTSVTVRTSPGTQSGASVAVTGPTLSYSDIARGLQAAGRAVSSLAPQNPIQNAAPAMSTFRTTIPGSFGMTASDRQTAMQDISRYLNSRP
jgi:hypothetical protein